MSLDLGSRVALIGRNSEMALLAGLMSEVARGRGSSVLVEGEPGIGKSALVPVTSSARRRRCSRSWRDCGYASLPRTPGGP